VAALFGPDCDVDRLDRHGHGGDCKHRERLVRAPARAGHQPGFSGASCGGIILVPLLVVSVKAIGFSAAMLAATAVMVVILLPVVLLWIRPGPAGRIERRTHFASEARIPAAPKATSRAIALRQLAFWTITIPFALALLAQVGFLVHQIALLEPKLGRSGAGLPLR